MKRLGFLAATAAVAIAPSLPVPAPEPIRLVVDPTKNFTFDDLVFNGRLIFIDAHCPNWPPGTVWVEEGIVWNQDGTFSKRMPLG